MKNKSNINIGSIGGGSGNDSLALSLYLKKNRYLDKKLNVEILDYSYSAWQTSNKKLLTDVYQAPPNNINFNWSFGDFKKDMGSFAGK